jgi:hypothetical protein
MPSCSYRLKSEGVIVLLIRKRSAIAALTIGLAFALLIPGTAWAPRVKGLPGYVGSCTMPVGGTLQDGVFVGDVLVSRYDAKEKDLVASINLTGSCRVGTTAQGFENADTTAHATIEKSTCKELSVRLGNAGVRDITIDLSDATLDSAPEKKDVVGKLLLCAVAKSHKKGFTRLTAGLLNIFFTD